MSELQTNRGFECIASGSWALYIPEMLVLTTEYCAYHFCSSERPFQNVTLACVGELPAESIGSDARSGGNVFVLYNQELNAKAHFYAIVSKSQVMLHLL